MTLKGPDSGSIEQEDNMPNLNNIMRMNAAIVEKDYRVCLILDYLFH